MSVANLVYIVAYFRGYIIMLPPYTRHFRCWQLHWIFYRTEKAINHILCLMQASHTLVLLDADNKKNHSHDMLATKVHSAYLYSMFQNDSIHHRHSGTRKSIVKLGKGRYSTYYQQRGDQAKWGWRTWGSIHIKFRSKTISNEQRATLNCPVELLS